MKGQMRFDDRYYKCHLTIGQGMLKAQGAGEMTKAMIFIDGTWLYYSKYRLGELEGKTEFNVDYGRLPDILSKALASQLGNDAIDVVRCYLFGSYAWNHDEQDSDAVSRQRDFFAMLKERYHYEVEVFPIDFKGRRLRRVDRQPDDSFEPREKCVDVALASRMMYYAAIPNAYDIAIIVAGDEDFAPLLRTVRLLGKRTAVTSIRACCCSELADAYDRLDTRDFDTIWLDDHLDDLELRFTRKQLQCESPLHEGDPLVWTTFTPRHNEKFYCDDCRARFEQERVGREVQAGPSAIAPGPHLAEVGAQLNGVVKTRFADRGFGFIQGTDGCDYFFHLSDLSDGLLFEDLYEGAPVCFQVRKQSTLGKAGAAQHVVNPEYVESEIATNDMVTIGLD